ncbi:MAG: cytochrome C [Ignavibacteriales bacterium]|nr:cytochrome C [Ignavibacteriales bacterium]
MTLLFCASVYSQISPGELTNAHKKLEGMSNCTKCHVLGDKVENSKCLDCHSEIKNLLAASKGYHSLLEVKKKDCATCHSEHHGREFQIVRFDEKKFDHAKTGFKLTGKHLTTECKNCHQGKNIIDAELKKRKATYLGLQQQCVTCHEDFYRKTLRENCSSCHNTTAFRPALMFEHEKAKFKLVGAHTKVTCEKCHSKEKRNGKPFQHFTGLNFKNCTPCHEDVHKGKFGLACEKCHSITTFKEVKSGMFNHDNTNYPLAGKHKLIECKDCHKQGMKVKLTFGKCIDCHSDYHKGEFVERGALSGERGGNAKVRDCSECHTVRGFSPSMFTLEKHYETKFKLAGSHLAVPCQSCHKKETNWHFRVDGTKCTQCHENVHGKELAEKFLGKNECERCHAGESWKTISFDHAKTDFVLLGKHSVAQCVDCHLSKTKDERGEKDEERGKTKVYVFDSVKQECATCHRDIHFGQFQKEGRTQCEQCHAFENWKPTKFNHSQTNFSLDGAHQKVQCLECHKKNEVNGATYTNYKIADYRCSACHN